MKYIYYLFKIEYNPFIYKMSKLNNSYSHSSLFGTNDKDKDKDTNPFKTNSLKTTKNTTSKIIFNTIFEKEKENSSLDKNISEKDNSIKTESNDFRIKEIRKSNSKNKFQKIEKCDHEYFFNSYCTADSKNEHGLLCYECLYKHHKDHISKCIPIRRKLYHKYINCYKDCIKNYRKKITDVCDRMNVILNYLLEEDIKDITDLFENKLNLNFELPVEVPIMDRIEIAVNNKLFNYFKNEINNAAYKILNLFKSDLNFLHACEGNPNDVETIELESSVNFDLIGIGFPEIPEELIRYIDISIYEENKVLANQITFKDYENKNAFSFSIAIFNNYPIKIKKDTKYSLVINNTEDLNYIFEDEEYNENSKIKIYSSNTETVLAFLVIK